MMNNESSRDHHFTTLQKLDPKELVRRARATDGSKGEGDDLVTFTKFEAQYLPDHRVVALSFSVAPKDSKNVIALISPMVLPVEGPPLAISQTVLGSDSNTFSVGFEVGGQLGAVIPDAFVGQTVLVGVAGMVIIPSGPPQMFSKQVSLRLGERS